VVERARLESEYTGNRIGGSNPPLSAITFIKPLYNKLLESIHLQSSSFCTTFCTAKVLARFGWIYAVGVGLTKGRGCLHNSFTGISTCLDMREAS
jgi:hypothetical protein